MLRRRDKSMRKCTAEFSYRESLFGKDPTDYASLTTMQKEWEPFSVFWNVAHDWHVNKNAWFNGRYANLPTRKVTPSSGF